VLLGNVLGFFEDRREMVVSHNSTEAEIRLRPSAGAENLTNRAEEITPTLVN
jgi:hypothetical protein